MSFNKYKVLNFILRLTSLFQIVILGFLLLNIFGNVSFFFFIYLCISFTFYFLLKKHLWVNLLYSEENDKVKDIQLIHKFVLRIILFSIFIVCSLWAFKDVTILVDLNHYWFFFRFNNSILKFFFIITLTIFMLFYSIYKIKKIIFYLNPTVEAFFSVLSNERIKFKFYNYYLNRLKRNFAVIQYNFWSLFLYLLLFFLISFYLVLSFKLIFFYFIFYFCITVIEFFLSICDFYYGIIVPFKSVTMYEKFLITASKIKNSKLRFLAVTVSAGIIYGAAQDKWDRDNHPDKPAFLGHCKVYLHKNYGFYKDETRGQLLLEETPNFKDYKIEPPLGVDGNLFSNETKKAILFKQKADDIIDVYIDEKYPYESLDEKLLRINFLYNQVFPKKYFLEKDVLEEKYEKDTVFLKFQLNELGKKYNIKERQSLNKEYFDKVMLDFDQKLETVSSLSNSSINDDLF